MQSVKSGGWDLVVVGRHSGPAHDAAERDRSFLLTDWGKESEYSGTFTIQRSTFGEERVQRRRQVVSLKWAGSGHVNQKFGRLGGDEMP